MKYRPEIDGLRSVAVLPVILFHGGFSLFSGGFVGVDVFFVISGFLITGIILKGLSEGEFSITEFYARRARRILPALFFVMLVTFPFAWMWMLPQQFKDYAQSIAATTVFSSNFLFWIESGYFAPSAELKPLLHTWSLAVEEQFYVIFPLILMAIWGWSQRRITMLIVLLALVSLLAAEWGWRTVPSANFYLLPFRAWELLAGALVAIWMQNRSGPLANNPLSLAGLLMILVSIFVFDGSTPFPSLYALLPVLGTAMILAFSGPTTWVGQVLMMRGCVGIGLISYSAYLWHQPLFSLARLSYDIEPPHWVMAVLSLAALVLAGLTWRFVEQPFRKPLTTHGRTVLMAGVMSIALGMIGAILSMTDWHRNSFMRSLPEVNLPLLARIEAVREGHAATLDTPGSCIFWLDELTEAYRLRFDDCFVRYGDAIAVFGDSHSRDVHNGVAGNWDHPFVIAIPQKACRPHLPASPCEGGHLVDTLSLYSDQIEHLFYVQAGFWLMLDKAGAELDRNLFGTGRDIEDPQLDLDGIARALNVLARLDKQVPITWIGPRLEPHVSWEEMLALPCDAVQERFALRPGHRAIFEELDAYLSLEVPKAGIGYISELDAIGFDPQTEIYDCDTVYWSDGDHWSEAGEALFGPRLVPHVVDVLNREASR